jgi:hypothetical protein
MSEQRATPGFKGTDPSSRVDLFKEQFLQEIGENGFQLEPGIEEAVIMLNLNGIKTSQSCEGHLETEGTDLAIPWEDLVKKEGKVVGPPWITLEIDVTDSQEFASETEQHLDYARKCFELEQHLLTLLDEFYSTRQSAADVRLYFFGEGSYTLTNQGGSLLQYPQGLERQMRGEKLEEYRAEMNGFANFLLQRAVSAI